MTASQASAENARKARDVIAALLGAEDREGRPADAGRDRRAQLERRGQAGRVRGAQLGRGEGRERRPGGRDRGRRPSQPARTSPPGPSFDRSDRDELYRSALRPRLRRCARQGADPRERGGAASVGTVLASRNRAVPEAPVPHERQSRARLSQTPVEPGTEEVQGDDRRDLQPRVMGSPSCSHSLQARTSCASRPASAEPRTTTQEVTPEPQ
mgnify:CR=1 FL=1